MCGAPARAVQELARHSELGTTQRYMHLSPAARDAAIQLLEDRGNMLATPHVDPGGTSRGCVGVAPTCDRLREQRGGAIWCEVV